MLDMETNARHAYQRVAADHKAKVAEDLREKLTPTIKAQLTEELRESVLTELRRTERPIVGTEIRREALLNSGFQQKLLDLDETLRR